MKVAKISSNQEDYVIGRVHSEAQKEGVCVTHGAQTRRCDHEGCSKQVVRGGKCV